MRRSKNEAKETIYRFLTKRDLENLILRYPGVIEPGASPYERNHQLKSGDQVGLILRNGKGKPILVEIEKDGADISNLNRAVRYQDAAKMEEKLRNSRVILAAPEFNEDVYEGASTYGVELVRLDKKLLVSLYTGDRQLREVSEPSETKYESFWLEKLKPFVHAYMNCTTCVNNREAAKEGGATEAQLRNIASRFQTEHSYDAMKANAWWFGCTGGGIETYDRFFLEWVADCANLERCTENLTRAEELIKNINEYLIAFKLSDISEKIKIAEAEDDKLTLKRLEEFEKALKFHTDISILFRSEARERRARYLSKEATQRRTKRRQALEKIGDNPQIRKYVLGKIREREGETTLSQLLVDVGMMFGYKPEELSKTSPELGFHGYDRVYQVVPIVKGACRELLEKKYITVDESWPHKTYSLTKDGKKRAKPTPPKIKKGKIFLTRQLIEEGFKEVQEVKGLFPQFSEV